MYEEMAKLNELMNFVVVMAVAMIGAAVRTSMALRDRTKIINKSWIVFVTDQIMGVAAGFIAYAIIVQWFGDYNYLIKLVGIGCASGSAKELMSVAKVSFLEGFKSLLGRMSGAVGQVEQKVEPAQTIENEEVKNG